MTIASHGRAPWRNFGGSDLQTILSSGVLRDPANFRFTNHTHHYPVVNVAENEEAFLVSADLPGLDSSEVDVRFEDGGLVLSGERKRVDTDKDAKLLNTEVAYGTFCRKVQLPASADPDNVSASMRNGVLTVTVEKRAAAKPKRITVES